MMASDQWCGVCCTQHTGTNRCPGELWATGPERHGWRINVESPQGIEAYGVLVAEALDVWRARILTYPNVLWLVPGGSGTLKFIGRTPSEAESKAIEFIREHCRERSLVMREQVQGVDVGRVDREAHALLDRPGDGPAPRKVRFLNVRYGVLNATDIGGTGNLSETGLFVITDDPLTTGSDVRLMLQIEGCESLLLDGLVRWMRKSPHAGRSPGMGVQLSEPPPRYLDYVRSLN
ncbi:MAG: hypothetical protein GY716_08905 [bacterium]|nr:hypothetical protein [bacterium]